MLYLHIINNQKNTTMKTIKKTQLGAETRVLRNLYKKHGRVNAEMQSVLQKRGYELCELGTGSRSYTCSGAIGIHYFANNNEKYFGIGVYNIGKKARKSGISVSIYRAWIKKVSE